MRRSAHHERRYSFLCHYSSFDFDLLRLPTHFRARQGCHLMYFVSFSFQVLPVTQKWILHIRFVIVMLLERSYQSSFADTHRGKARSSSLTRPGNPAPDPPSHQSVSQPVSLSLLYQFFFPVLFMPPSGHYLFAPFFYLQRESNEVKASSPVAAAAVCAAAAAAAVPGEGLFVFNFSPHTEPLFFKVCAYRGTNVVEICEGFL